MAMLMLTEFCTRNCPFCFAGDAVEHNADTGPEMPFRSVIRAAGVLKAAWTPVISLGGGEPTLHSRFVEIIDMLLAEGFYVKLFTGGIASRDVLDYLVPIKPENLLVVVNMQNPTDAPDEEREAVQNTLSTLGPKVVPAATIAEVDADIDFLLETVEKYGTQKTVRLGLAHPAGSGGNRFIEPSDYKAAGARIAEFAQKATEKDIEVSFDCGFVRCMFENDPPEGAVFRCTPALDVWTDNTVTYCLALSDSMRTDFFTSGGIKEIEEDFMKRSAPFLKAGLFPECHTCEYAESGECTGGCLAHIRKTFNSGGEPL